MSDAGDRLIKAAKQAEAMTGEPVDNSELVKELLRVVESLEAELSGVHAGTHKILEVD